MTQLSESFAGMALELVEIFGSSKYYLRQTTPGVIDPDYPTKPAVDVTTDYPCKAAIVDYNVDEVDGTTVLRGDKQVIIPVNGNTLPDEILQGFQFVDGAVVWNVISKVNPLEVNATTVAYIVQVRR